MATSNWKKMSELTKLVDEAYKCQTKHRQYKHGYGPLKVGEVVFAKITNMQQPQLVTYLGKKKGIKTFLLSGHGNVTIEKIVDKIPNYYGVWQELKQGPFLANHIWEYSRDLNKKRLALETEILELEIENHRLKEKCKRKYKNAKNNNRV